MVNPRKLKFSWLPKCRIGNQKWIGSAVSRYLHPQQVSTGGDIRDQITFDQVPPLFVDQSFERYEAEFTAGRHEQMFRVPYERADRLHDAIVELARKGLRFSAARIAERLPE